MAVATRCNTIRILKIRRSVVLGRQLRGVRKEWETPRLIARGRNFDFIECDAHHEAQAQRPVRAATLWSWKFRARLPDNAKNGADRRTGGDARRGRRTLTRRVFTRKPTQQPSAECPDATADQGAPSPRWHSAVILRRIPRRATPPGAVARRSTPPPSSECGRSRRAYKMG